MMQNYSKNPKPARNETKFNNTKKWRNHLDYTTFLIDSYFCLSLFLENYLTSSNLTNIDYQRIMFVWDKYGRFKLLFYKQEICI